MKTTIFTLAVLCAGLQAIAQPDTDKTPRDGASLRLVPSLAELQQSIHQHYQQQLAAELAEFAEMRKGDWMKYLPNVGTTYTHTLARGSASGRSLWPTVSFNTNLIYQARRDKQTREAKRRSIEQKIRLEERKTLAAVQTMVTEYHIRLRELETQKLILETDRQLHAIQKDKYERSEIPPSDYLPAYKRWLQVQLGFRQLEDELVLLRGRILERSFYWGD
jgi:hypothetical protein